ncbi:hypothetical protein AALO_G00109540 [Alosa alosa]|uniref:Gypsy retrotransposon integrase-like protein 1 n=1 Tax=Alosa alosa TaxID=278164 RepID=A0AAV6GSW4_9TELE|nr:hypothetical protein AALO_G00109540 [Alosa alosa]
MVVTRSQSSKTAYKEEQASSDPLHELPFASSDVECVSSGRVKKSRQQRRQDRLEGTVKRARELPVAQPDGDWEELVTDIKQMQREDGPLKKAFEKVIEQDGVRTGVPPNLAGEGYVLRGGILYHQPDGGREERLVVPTQLHSRVLAMGHSIPWAGHLGLPKTYARIAARFFWPGMYKDVQEFGRACSECQLTSKYTVSPYPLQQLPCIDVPFSRIAMDIVGPLERMQSGFKYILVVCDYATRYPEAFPLRRISARPIAQALLQFSRVGIPREIITDQGTAFLSKSLKQVYDVLGIKGIKTTLYHPQTDGLVERFNQTLKSMLRKFVAENGKDWDRWLPYLLFTYREVPQASTGFSPFELLFGWPVRGPLDVLKEAWEGPQTTETQSVLAHVLKRREKME